MWITLLIVHGLLAFLLLGALTHQTVSVAWPAKSKARFVQSFAAVRSPAYTNAVIVLFLITFSLGGLIYTDYRLGARIAMEQLRLFGPIGLFELKEHFMAMAFALLPTYWLLWKKVPLAEHSKARTLVTCVICFCAWWGFLVGHILNNIRGIGG